MKYSTIYFIVFFLCASANYSCKKDPYAKYEQGYLLKDVEIPEQLYSLEDARLLIRKFSKEPIPSNYKTPDYLVSGHSIDEVYELFYTRYPDLVKKNGDDYLEAIATNPRGYYFMINENKKLRELYREEMIKKSQYIDEQIKAQEERWEKARRERGEVE